MTVLIICSQYNSRLFGFFCSLRIRSILGKKPSTGSPNNTHCLQCNQMLTQDKRYFKCCLLFFLNSTLHDLKIFKVCLYSQLSFTVLLIKQSIEKGIV